VANLAPDGALHAIFVRSPFAFARILAIDSKPALAVSGVHAVFTQRDLREMGAGTLPVGWIVPGQHAVEIDLLAEDVVRYVGDPVAVVLADSAALAEDAAELVAVDYEAWPAVPDVHGALAEDAPLLHPKWGENVMARIRVEAGDVDGAFDGAAVVLSERFSIGRSSAMPLETRAAVATYDRFMDEVTLVSSTQSPHHVRVDIASCLGRPEGSIRVVAPDVGGSFGAKDHACASEAVICLLSIRLGRGILWVEGRGEHVATSGHSREQTYEIELAADGDGRILGIRGRLLFDAGAYPSSHGIGTAIYSAAVLPSVYRFSHYRLEALGVVTNKAPSGAYRGYGAPEAAFVIESLVDALGRRLGLDPVDVRRRNILMPDEMSRPTASGCLYDPVDLPRLLNLALDRADYESFRATQQADEAAQSTVREGVGLACVVLMGGFGPSRSSVEAGMRYGGHESAIVRMDGEGKAVVLTGLPTIGQGLETALAQVCGARLGIDPERDVQVLAGDTAVTPYSPVGPISSRGAPVGASATDVAAARVAETLRRGAAALLEVASSDVELHGGRASVRGAPDTGVSIADVALAIRRGVLVPHGVDPLLEAVAVFEPPELTYSFGVHVAVVRVDTASGEVRVLRYVTASDCGTLLNPAIVRGQIEGGVIQGIGGALFEEIVYGPDGELLTVGLTDYAMPSAAEVPEVEVYLLETPTSRNPTGARGAGEIGIIGPAAAIANAVADAMGSGVAAPRRVPLTSERVWSLANGRLTV
jgi:carbon-monoxide dehydrogenase large subunit